MRVIGSRIAAAVVAAAIVFNPAAAVAAGAAPQATQQASQASWLTLSMLSPSGAIGLAGAAAQPSTETPPPPPEAAPPPPEANGVAGVPLPVLGIWLAGIALAVYIVTKNHHSRFNIPTSPF